MEALREVVAWLVAASAFIVWLLFLPQIRIMYKVKRADSISLGTVGGSFSIQSLIFMHAILNYDYRLAFLQSTSMFFLCIVIIMIIYYRKFPEGRKLS